jgi:hypothetical protein
MRGELKVLFNKKLLHLKLDTCYFNIQKPICSACNVPTDISHFLIDSLEVRGIVLNLQNVMWTEKPMILVSLLYNYNNYLKIHKL